MANLGIRSIQLTLGALALAVAGMACAQTTEAAPAMEMAKPAAKSAEMKSHKPMHKQMHKPMHKRDANPASREAAAAKAEAKRGKLDDGQSANQFERNAYARCQVFKTDIDRQACADRVKQGAISGSVQDGGILRESTIEVPVGQ
ncbi:MAG: hypothetical protein RR718_14805 [Comamonas sp.]